jgi:hypothetical protein
MPSLNPNIFLVARERLGMPPFLECPLTGHIAINRINRISYASLAEGFEMGDCGLQNVTN